MPAPHPSVMMGPPPGHGPGGPNHAQAADVAGTLRSVVRYFAAEKLLVALMLLIVVLGVACGVIAPSQQAHVIDCLAGTDATPFGEALVAMLIAYLLYAACSLGQGWISAHLSTRVVRRMREELFGKVVDLPISFLDHHSHGDVMSRMTNDIENISLTVSEALPSLVSGLLTVLGTFAIMFWYCWQLALLSLITVALSLVLTRILARAARKHMRQRQAMLGKLNGTVEESIYEYRSITVYNRQGVAKERFARYSDAEAKASIMAEVFAGTMGPVMNFVSNLSFVVMAACGGFFAYQGYISIGVISAFIVYAKQFGRPIGDLSMVYGQLQSAVASAERVFQVLDEASERDADEVSATLEGSGEHGAEIRFEHVRFGYEQERNVIDDFSLTVAPGRKIALVGATGSGKTTIVSLLERFYEVGEGRIFIDGTDIRQLSRDELRHQVAIVLQDTSLFAATVAENLRYGNADATMEQVRAAAEMSHCAAAIEALPRGYETKLTAGGEELSQGQRQLLSIARAFVADPRILVLDEATSNVDTRTEKLVQDAMQQIMRDRTSIVIAHRLSTVQDADQIVVMSEGRIVETGTHDELIAAGGTYHDLYMTQFEGFEI